MTETERSSTRTRTTTSAGIRSFREQLFSGCAKPTLVKSGTMAGISPAWPISYDELEPYYAQAERLYLIHGVAGEDPCEPRRSGPYPFSCISHEPRIQQLSNDFARLGLQPFHTPLGVMLDEKNRHKCRCIRCNTCDGFPCLVNEGTRTSAASNRHSSTRTTAKVTRLETDSSAHVVTGVRVERDGAEEIYSGDIVATSAGAINSAALLLRSGNDKHPNGLANGSDVVGKHYMGYVNSVLMAIAKCPNPTVFQKTLSVNDCYHASKEWPYPMGHISFAGELDGETRLRLRHILARERSVPGWKR